MRLLSKVKLMWWYVTHPVTLIALPFAYALSKGIEEEFEAAAAELHEDEHEGNGP